MANHPGYDRGGRLRHGTFAVTKLNQRRTLFRETLHPGDSSTPIVRVFKEELQLVVVHPRRQVFHPDYICWFQKSWGKLELFTCVVADTFNNKFVGIYKTK